MSNIKKTDGGVPKRRPQLEEARAQRPESEPLPPRRPDVYQASGGASSRPPDSTGQASTTHAHQVALETLRIVQKGLTQLGEWRVGVNARGDRFIVLDEPPTPTLIGRILSAGRDALTFTVAQGDQTRRMRLDLNTAQVHSEGTYWRGPDPVSGPPPPTRPYSELVALGPRGSRECQNLLAEVAWDGRRALVGTRAPSDWKPLSPEDLSSRCGWSQSVTVMDLLQRGVPATAIHVHWAPTLLSLTDTAAAAHAFVVVTPPDQRIYLVDLTFRQFFGESSQPESAVARALQQTQSGRDFSETLLREGWVGLTEHFAQMYLQALRGRSDLDGVDPRILLRSSRPASDVPQLNPQAISRADF